MEVSKTPNKKEDTTMKRKKFLALALAGVMTAATLTACAPLEDLYDWFFGSGSASHGSEKGLVTESEALENKLKTYLKLSGTTASDRAKKTLEAVAKEFNTGWLDPNNNELNEKAKTALESITKEKLAENEQLWVDVMEWPSSDGTTVTNPDNRRMYWDKYQYLPPDLGGSYHDCVLMYYGELKRLLKFHNINDAELYAGTFQKNGKTYAAMVIIW